MAVVEAHDLHRVYKTHTGTIRRRVKQIEAVRGVSFEIEKGELFGLLGPNGAGKTTTIKMLITLLIPTSGTRKRPRPRRRQGRRARSGSASATSSAASAVSTSGSPATTTSATSPSSTACPPKVQKPRIEELLELVGLKGREHERTEGYSRGMKQRLHVARGLLHDPEVVFLDEPTIGLDPVGARELRATIGTLTEAGKTILLTTHYMFEADALCDRIAVISQGQIVAEGTPEQLKSRVAIGRGDRGRGLRHPRRDGRAPAHPRGRLVRLGRGARPGAGAERPDPRGRPADAAILGHLNGSNVGRVSHREPTLEDAYVALVKDE